MADKETARSRRPRWTKEEDTLLVTQKKLGADKATIVAAYSAAYPSAGRPEKGILAHLVKLTAKKRVKAVEQTAEKVVILDPGQATKDVNDIVSRFSEPERSRIIAAVFALSGAFQYTPGSGAASDHGQAAIRTSAV
jgi:hypothetical protein